MSRLSLPAGLILAAITLAAVRPAAAITVIAQDDADNAAYSAAYSSGSNFNGLNGGTGFNAFSTAATLDPYGNYIKSGSPIGSGTDGKAFNLYNDDTEKRVDATRSFNFTNTGAGTTPLTVGSTFSADFKNLGIANGGFVGYTLRDTLGTTLFQFGFIGGTQNYFFGDGTTSTDTGLFYTSGGLHTSVTLTAPTTYSFSVQRLSDASPTVFTSTLGAGGAIDRVVFSDIGGGKGSDTQFNNLSITGPDVTAAPEPSQMAALSICALGLGGLMLARRRQNMRLA